MALDYAAAVPVLKEMYDDDLNQDLVPSTTPGLDLINKDESVGGDTKRWNPKYGLPESISNDFSIAATASTDYHSRWVKGNLEYNTKSGVVEIDGDTIERCNGDQVAFIQAAKEEMDGGMRTLKVRRAIEFFSTGWGELGTIATIPGSTNTITLVRKSDARKVEIDQLHVFAAAKATGALRSSTALKVVGVNQVTGVVTYNANLSTVSAAVGDTIFFAGDRHNAANPKRITPVGFEGWIPFDEAELDADFFGVDRSVNPTRLGGHRLDGRGGNLEEVLQEADAMVASHGGTLDHFFVSPKTYKNLALTLGTRVRYQPLQKGNIGFSSISVTGQSGDINVVSDRFVPDDRIYGATLDTWTFASSGKLTKINDQDGMAIQRHPQKDAVVARLTSRLALVYCSNPGSNITVAVDAE